MKKKLFTYAVVLVFAVGTMSATGVGPQSGSSYNVSAYSGMVTSGLGCSAKFDSVPVYWALTTNINSSDHTFYFNTELTGDYWVMNPNIKGIWSWFWGFGGVVSTGSDGSVFYLNAGPRAVIGMNWIFCTGFLELYVQNAVEPEISFVFTGTEENELPRFPVYFPFDAGLRFWF
jgi:hypothetical protein